jgi:hypothetical protein
MNERLLLEGRAAMPVRSSTVDKLLDIIEIICESRKLGGYLVGFTTWAALKKGGSYVRHRFPYFVVLADKLKLHDALDLERRLFERIKSEGGVRWKKYHLKKIAGPYHPSPGTSRIDPLMLGCAVYMAFWEKT